MTFPSGWATGDAFDLLGEQGAAFAQVVEIAGEFAYGLAPCGFCCDDYALRVQRSPDGLCELHSRTRGSFGYTTPHVVAPGLAELCGRAPTAQGVADPAAGDELVADGALQRGRHRQQRVAQTVRDPGGIGCEVNVTAVGGSANQSAVRR